MSFISIWMERNEMAHFSTSKTKNPIFFRYYILVPFTPLAKALNRERDYDDHEGGGGGFTTAILAEYLAKIEELSCLMDYGDC